MLRKPGIKFRASARTESRRPKARLRATRRLEEQESVYGNEAEAGGEFHRGGVCLQGMPRRLFSEGAHVPDLVRRAPRRVAPPPVPVPRVYGDVPQPLRLPPRVAEGDGNASDEGGGHGRAATQGPLQLRPQTWRQATDLLRPRQKPHHALRRFVQPLAFAEEVRHHWQGFPTGQGLREGAAFSGIAMTSPASPLRATASEIASRAGPPTTHTSFSSPSRVTKLGLGTHSRPRTSQRPSNSIQRVSTKRGTSGSSAESRACSFGGSGILTPEAVGRERESPRGD